MTGAVVISSQASTGTMKKLPALLTALAIVAWSPVAAMGTEVFLYFSALEKMLLHEVFTQGGRSFLFGSDDSPCLYGHLSQPRVSSRGNRLVLSMSFEGKIGQDVGAACVGLADEFRFSFSGVPMYRDGYLFLHDVSFSEGSRFPQFNEYVREFVELQMQGFFRRNVMEGVLQLIEANRQSAPVAVELTGLDIPRLVVHSDGLSVTVDVSVVLR